MEPLIRIEAITKRFPRVLANDAVSLDVAQGHIHALVGENGAGKSTLMNVLYGLLKPDSGSIHLKGVRLPAEQGFLGLDYGIGMIHQHFMLIGKFTALENIVLGVEPHRGIMLDLKSARSRVERLMRTYGMTVEPDKLIDDLSVGEEQRVEILKVLYRDASIIIMDEPTAVLTPQETRGLFSTLRALTRDGRTVIFITHKLEEVMEVADMVTVMRAGRILGTMPTSETTVQDLAEMMVGRKLESVPERHADIVPETVLEIEDLSLRSPKGQSLLQHVSFSVRRGEIFGICGVDGNGQDELFETLIGLLRPQTGEVRFLGEDITHMPTVERLGAGLAHIPPDRIRMGLVTGLSVEENLILGKHNDRRLSGLVLLDSGAVRRLATDLIADFGIEPQVPEMKAGLLSGGNQQKIVAARELSRQPELLVASQPTRGLDIGAARLIHDLLIRQAEAGRSVLLISADLAEIMSLADRIGVMYRGAIVGVVDRKDATEEGLGLMMAGARA
jgi:simple sugar transport system ATP-binding protein